MKKLHVKIKLFLSFIVAVIRKNLKIGLNSGTLIHQDDFGNSYPLRELFRKFKCLYFSPINNIDEFLSLEWAEITEIYRNCQNEEIKMMHAMYCKHTVF